MSGVDLGGGRAVQCGSHFTSMCPHCYGDVPPAEDFTCQTCGIHICKACALGSPPCPGREAIEADCARRREALKKTGVRFLPLLFVRWLRSKILP
jgi:hypothetical protein